MFVSVVTNALRMNLDISLIESFCNQELAIESTWGMAQLHNFFAEMAMIEKGVPYSELGIKERRESSNPAILTPRMQSGSEQNQIAYGIASHVSFKNVLASETAPGSIALLNLKGVIRSESMLSTRGIDSFLTDLHFVYTNPNIKGVIVNVLSGGGESAASFKLRNAIKEKNKPVIALVDFAASGAYLAITGADEILGSSNASQFGSIGAYLSLNLKELKAYAEEYVHIYADQSGDKNAPLRQAALGDFTGIKTMVNRIATDFRNAVLEDRTLKGQETVIEKTLSGGLFNAVEAKRRGLSDMTGNLNTAVRRVNYYADRL